MNISGTKEPHDTPCIGVCSVDLGDPMCRGCGRYPYEIRAWGSFNDEHKAKINEILPVRLTNTNEE